jgi:hypothetical protein
MRVLPVKYIPEELWFKEKLSIPEKLKITYSEQLKGLGMLEKAIKGNPKNSAIHGGITDEETIEHFTYRFPVSSGRMEFVTISPNDDMVKVSDAILSTFSTGEVSVLDIPGGAGAAMCSLLTTLAVLRYEGLLPILPLTVRIMCGDLAPKANEIYEKMVSKIKPFLDENGITVHYKSMTWDATRNDHTAQLIDSWFEISKPHSEYVVCVSNFTGALIGAGIFDEFKPCLSQILARLYDKKSTLIWIEPGSKSTNKLIKKLLEFVSDAIKWFTKTGEDDVFLKSSYTMKNPLNNGEYQSSVAVQKFKRN